MVGAGGLVAVDHSNSQPGAQGQRVGRCSTSRRPVVAIRAGMLMSLVRMAAHRAARINEATAVVRAMLNAITAAATHGSSSMLVIALRTLRFMRAVTLNHALCRTAVPTNAHPQWAESARARIRPSRQQPGL